MRSLPVLLALVGAAPALACTCAPLDVGRAFEEADFVFIGRVADAPAGQVIVPPGEYGWTNEVTVDEELKGLVNGFATPGPEPSTSRAAVVTVLSSDICSSSLTRGERYVVFAHGSYYGIPQVRGCGGTMPVASFEASDLAALRAASARLDPPPDVLDVDAPVGPHVRGGTGEGSPGSPVWAALAASLLANVALAVGLWARRRER